MRMRGYVSIVGITGVAVIAVCAGCAAHTQAVVPVPEQGAPRPPAHVVREEIPTPPVMPPLGASDEATSSQLDRAVDEGKALGRELQWVEAEETAASGEMAAGEYIVTYLITPADDYYDLEAAQSNLPAHHTTVVPGSAHVAVVVQDAADGRMVQGLEVRAVLRSEDSGDERSTTLPFEWHPILNRYGENLVLPSSPFTLRVYISMPTYARHDHVNGDRFGKDVMARFAHVVVSSDSLAVASQHLARGESLETAALARDEGDAIDRPITEMLRSADVSGSQVRSGDYKVAVVVQGARGAWEAHDGDLSYESPSANIGPVAHLDVSIRDAVTGRFVPGLKVRATILDSRKREIDTYSAPFMWHPWMNHYGLNVPVPGKGRYTVRVRADAPAFRRFGSTALRKFNKAVDVTVRNVRFNVAGDDNAADIRIR
jgi:uncharacterized protein involved in high-affinity Fe2+ transport